MRSSYIYNMMSYFKKHLNILEYNLKPLSIEAMNLLYKANNIQHQNTLVYSDFSVSLIKLITETYMGDDLMDVNDRRSHFDWCWDKNIENFKKEQIDLKTSEELKDYYSVFMEVTFYEKEDKEGDESLSESIIKHWRDIFNTQGVKSRAEVDIFLEVYSLFNSELFDKKQL